MAILKTEDGSLPDVTLRATVPRLHAGAFAAVLATPAIVIACLLPIKLLLPVLSVVSFVIAVSTGLFAFCAKVDRRAPGITLWDVAGGFTLIWVAAGLMGRPRYFIEWFERLVMMP
jgi:hypothetical protein